eukprot:PhM_4_TR13318/c0_g1_i2/m.20898/K02930/RP-L4e, RPL4; large subunit ribosomal protein L4e
MAARPNVNVFSSTEAKIVGSSALPSVFMTPIRHDLVRFVHTNIAKNARQAYGVTRRQGHRTTAESWGTGRAVARIPRVSGGGTNRSGQGAYGNMCRGGHMFSATKTFRRWHRHVNKNQRRLAVASALAASAVPALVTSRGHRIDAIPEIPFVVDDAVASLNKTAEAVKFLTTSKALTDVEKVDASRHVRPTKGKWRNRRYVSRKGPLLVLASRAGQNAFSNIRGVEVANVNFLNLLQLAPGGHLGRFVIWSKGAFERLQQVFGSTSDVSAAKAGFMLPMPMVKNTDISRVINSAEVQKVCRNKTKAFRPARQNVNPLRKRSSLKALSPFASVNLHNKAVAERARAKAAATRAKARRAEVKARRESLEKSKAAVKAAGGKKPAAKATKKK